MIGLFLDYSLQIFIRSSSEVWLTGFAMSILLLMRVFQFCTTLVEFCVYMREENIHFAYFSFHFSLGILVQSFVFD